MAKVTSKLQVTVPKVIADRYGIGPGDEIEWLPAGDSIRVVPASNAKPTVSADERLALFDAATLRQKKRQGSVGKAGAPRPKDRGWAREELYRRGRPR